MLEFVCTLTAHALKIVARPSMFTPRMSAAVAVTPSDGASLHFFAIATPFPKAH